MAVSAERGGYMIVRRSYSLPARPPGGGGRRVRSAGVLLLASILLALFPQNAALAHGHPEPQDRHGFGVWSSTGTCLWSHVLQWHYRHELHSQTWARSGGPSACYYPVNRPAYSIQHRTEYYKSQPWLGGPYSWCTSMWGWAKNTTSTWHLATIINDDVWRWNCNHGAGVYVDITIDFWQRWWWGDGYLPSSGGAAWRPATHHCHCP